MVTKAKESSGWAGRQKFRSPNTYADCIFSAGILLHTDILSEKALCVHPVCRTLNVQSSNLVMNDQLGMPKKMPRKPLEFGFL